MNDLTTELSRQAFAPVILSDLAGFVQSFAARSKGLARRIAESEYAVPFLRTAAISEYFCKICLNRPHLVAAILDSNALRSDHRWPDVATIKMHKPNDDEAILADLREQRHREMLRILWRECGGLSTVEETLHNLSDLADEMINCAVRASFLSLTEMYGVPDGEKEPDQLMVIAMGKLGGHELNVSSDVDLVFLHSHRGETSGPRAIEHQDFFIRQTKLTIDYLSRLTADGFVYRVDTRLRPFGTSGRPCVGLNALEQYLSIHGREWERYAYIKHRSVVASALQQAELQDILRPFVYRKYLDFGVFEGLREMKSLIDAEIVRKDLVTDIKRGRGGIRQIEFIVQTMQLVYGGKRQTLQTNSLYKALDALGAAQFISAQDREQLYQDYNFLRRIENGLHAARDQQVHKLPTSELGQERLVVLMQKQGWPELQTEIEQVRARVQRRFDQLSLSPKGSESDKQQSRAARLWQHSIDAEDSEAPKPKTSGAESPDEGSPDAQSTEPLPELLKSLRVLGTNGLRDRLDTSGRARLDQLIPVLMQELATLPDPLSCVPELVRVLEGIGRRSAYFSLLIENPPAMRRVISICQQSPALAQLLASSPMLLDTLVDPRGSSNQLTRVALKARFDQQFGALDPLDEERCLLALCEFRQSTVFDVAVADMEGQMPIMKISDRLTEVAELVLSEAIRMATGQMQHRYGTPRYADTPNREAEFAVVGYGKLGGLELAYGSDLDLVFLYDDGGAGQTDGEDPIDNTVYFSRLTQRLIHILTIPTAYGALYEVDMRLRPSGRSGLLVSRLKAFENYQATQAWTWEHQALLRARGVGGESGLLQRFEQIRSGILQKPRDPQRLVEDVAQMRSKMKGALDTSDAEKFDLKHGTGGLVDLEFLVQYLVLLHAQSYPELTRYSDNVRQIEVLQQFAVLTGEMGAEISRIYLDYRQYIHRRTLAGKGVHTDTSAFLAERQLIVEVLARHKLA